MNTTTTRTPIHIPTPLRAYTNDEAVVTAEGATAGEALRDLVQRHPALEPHLYDEDGRLRSFVTVFRGDEDIRHLGREATPLHEGDDLSIIPSIAGGCRVSTVECRMSNPGC